MHGRIGSVVITCEHGGHQVPEEFAPLFRGAEQTLESHRGWDPGALELAERFAGRLNAPLRTAAVTRLLVELNRSPRHRSLFSEFTRPLEPVLRERLLREYYLPYRNRVEELVGVQIVRAAPVVHLSIHSFTPLLARRVRQGDVGLLYDPRRPLELALCRAWQQALRNRRLDLCVRRNYPYLGKSDGFTTHLRKLFAAEVYAGVEVEVNQRWPLEGGSRWSALQDDIIDSFRAALTFVADGATGASPPSRP